MPPRKKALNRGRSDYWRAQTSIPRLGERSQEFIKFTDDRNSPEPLGIHSSYHEVGHAGAQSLIKVGATSCVDDKRKESSNVSDKKHSTPLWNTKLQTEDLFSIFDFMSDDHRKESSNVNGNKYSTSLWNAKIPTEDLPSIFDVMQDDHRKESSNVSGNKYSTPLWNTKPPAVDFASIFKSMQNDHPEYSRNVNGNKIRSVATTHWDKKSPAKILPGFLTCDDNRPKRSSAESYPTFFKLKQDGNQQASGNVSDNKKPPTGGPPIISQSMLDDLREESGNVSDNKRSDPLWNQKSSTEDLPSFFKTVQDDYRNRSGNFNASDCYKSPDGVYSLFLIAKQGGNQQESGNVSGSKRSAALGNKEPPAKAYSLFPIAKQGGNQQESGNVSDSKHSAALGNKESPAEVHPSLLGDIDDKKDGDQQESRKSSDDKQDGIQQESGNISDDKHSTALQNKKSPAKASPSLAEIIHAALFEFSSDEEDGDQEESSNVSNNEYSIASDNKDSNVECSYANNLKASCSPLSSDQEPQLPASVPIEHASLSALSSPESKSTSNTLTLAAKGKKRSSSELEDESTENDGSGSESRKKTCLDSPPVTRTIIQEPAAPAKINNENSATTKPMLGKRKHEYEAEEANLRKVLKTKQFC
ncbi:hypothetical protein BD408DRAFT_462102 [Parasitella parasitica]|nr:hypothetical protein BD408DRAFT_462102 [Parasitella parasitica]